jgi:hypothetical protein
LGLFFIFSLNCILLGFFLLNFILTLFVGFAYFYINIFLLILSFKIKLVDNDAFWLNLGKKFHQKWLLEVRPGLKILLGLPYFFPFSKLIFFFIFFIIFKFYFVIFYGLILSLSLFFLNICSLIFFCLILLGYSSTIFFYWTLPFFLSINNLSYYKWFLISPLMIFLIFQVWS